MNSLRSIRILPVFLVFLLAAALPQGVAPAYAQGTAQAIVSGIPPILQSPFVVDFEQDYQQRRFQMQFVYTGQQPASFRFVASMTKEGQQLFSVTSEPAYFEPGTYLYTHLSDNPSISFSEGFDDLVDQLSGRIKRQVIESGAFPEGFYTLRVEPVAADAGSFVTGVAGTSTFTVMYPEPPRLLSVSDQSSLNTLHPSFAWTPVIAPPGTTVDYDVLITEVLSSQTPLQALLGNRAHAQVSLTGQSTFSYIANQLPLEAGKTYAWQVAATAELAGRVLPLKDDGRSEIWTFTVGAAPGLVAEAPSYVSDGTGEDLDYVNSVTSLSANWGPVTGASSYSYAIGSSSGGTDVLNWTGAGQQTQTTRSELSLAPGMKYYVSVRAVGSDGKESPAVNSDGVLIDTSLPTSVVEVPAVKNKPGEPFVNDASVQVAWSGWDDTSPVTEFEIQFKRGGDLSWTTWMAKTDQQSASFPSSIYGGDGRYRFRSFAWDAAGNKKVFEDYKPIVGHYVPADEIVEAEVVVDTEAPTSKVSPLDPQQSSASFLVSWSGTDATSGIKSYGIEYREDDGSWQSWLTAVAGTTTSSQFQGTAGHTYAFRSAATDSSGNVEDAPQLADAFTTTLGAALALTATATPALSNYYNIEEDDGTVIYSCLHSYSSNVDSCPAVTLLFAAPAGVSIKVDQASLTWFDDTGVQVADEAYSNLFVGSVSPVLKNGETAKIDLTPNRVGSFFDNVIKKADATAGLPYLNPQDQKAALAPITHNVTAVLRGNYMGSDQVPHSLSSNPVSIKVVYRPTGPPLYTVAVSATPSTISYTPTKLTNNVDVKLSLVGAQGDELTLDTVVNRWYDGSGKLFDEPKKTLATPLVLKDTPPTGPGAFMDVTRNLALTLSESSVTKALEGKSSSTYTLHVEYRGKDQHGSPVAFSTTKPITVQFYADAPKLLVSFSPNSIVFSPAKLQHTVDISYTLTSPVSSSVQVESVTNYWYDEDKKLFDKGTATVTPFVVQSGQTVVRTLPYSWSDTSLQTALGGKDNAFKTVKLEANAKDANQNTVTGTTVEPLTIYVQKSDVSVDVTFSPTTVTFTPDKLSNQVSVTYTLTSPSGKSVTLDKSSNRWYEEDGSLFWSDSTAFASPRQLTTAASLSFSDTFGFSQTQLATLAGKDKAAYTIEIVYWGSDSDGTPVKAATTKPLTALFSASASNLVATVTPSKQIFDSKNLQRKWTTKLDYKGDVTLDVTSADVTWYDLGGKQVSKDKIELLKTYKFATPSSSNTFALAHTITDYERTLTLDRPGSVWMTTNSDGKYKEEFLKLRFEFSGTDAAGRTIKALSNEVEVTLREPVYPLEVTSNPPSLSTDDSPVDLDITINSSVESTVALSTRTVRLLKGTAVVPPIGMEAFDGMGKPATVQSTVVLGPLEVISAKGLWKDKVSISLNTSYLLGTEDSTEVSAEITYKGKDASGQDVEGRVFVPIKLKKPGQVDDTDSLVAEAGHYELIPNVASVQALKDLTIVTTDAGNRVLNGVVRLILGPSPFDSTKLGVDATNLTFAPVQGKAGHWTVKSGRLREKGTQLKPDLFRIYKDVVRINEISYEHSRGNPMLIDKAEARIPVLEKTIYLTNLVIDKNGLQMKTAEAEVSAFGLTFRITDIQHQSTSTGSDLALTTGLRLAGKSKSDEFAVTTLKITNTGGKETVNMTAKPGNPIRLIGQTDYLNLKAFSFTKTPTDEVVMSVEVESQGLPLVSKVGPLTGFIEYEKSGKARGRLDFIKETTPGTPANDTSVLEIGKLAKIDVTYVGVQIANKQVTTMNGGVAETTFELDESQSYVGLVADLYLPFMDGQNDRISIGTVTSTSVSPGIQVNFDATVTTKTVTVAKNAKLDLGPLFLELQSLSFKAYPFHMGFSGGIGVDAPGIVEGKLSVTGLTVDQDGNFSNFATAVDKGGQLTILKAVGVGFKDFSYSNKPAPLPYQDGVASSAKGGPEKVVKDLSVNVDSYFQLEGASLTLTTFTGGFDRLLVYEKNGNTSFILKGANVNVKNQVDINVDFSYINDGNTNALTAGGKAKIANKYSAGVYGALGTRSGESYWGFYVGVAGLQIPVGPGINLEEIGGGFFWNPTLSDIDKVKNAAGFKDPKLSAHIAAMKPTSTSPLTFAAFLNGGVSIGANEVFKGRGLLTITGNSAKLNVEAEVLAGTVKGNGYLEISWNPEYVEGNFKIIVDVPLLDCEDKLEFYAYSDQLWGVMGKVQVGVLSFVTTTAEFYAGNDGFMFDLVVKKGIDIFIISGGIELEVMAWWRKDVSWGAYAAGKAYGDLLAGLIGGEVGLEGAFIGSPEFVIFVAGHLKVEILWTDVFNGRVWVSMGENGFDSGTGSGKYDKIISDARNTGKQMKSSMEQLAKDLEKAQNSLLTLSSQELAAAGNALVQNLENPLGRPLLMAEYEKDRDFVIPAARGSFNSAFGVIWNSQSPVFWNRKVNLNSKKSNIDGLLGQLKSDEASLRSALLKAQDLLTGKLPTVKEIGTYGNPVSQPKYQTVAVVDSTGATVMKTVKAAYQFDVQKAKSLSSGVKQEMADAKAYRQKLVQMAQEFGSKMKGVDRLLSGTGTSVNQVVGNYAYASQLIGGYTTDRLDYFDDRLKHYTKLWFDLSALETQLMSDIAKDLIAVTTDKKQKTLQRNKLQNMLLSLAELPPKDLKATDPNWTVLAATAGHQIWYKIPMAGFESVSTGSAQARQKFVAEFQNTNNKFQADWSLATLSADKVHARKAKLYTLLYDLFDQLSIEAGTRKETPATTGNMVIGILALGTPGTDSSTQTAQLSGGGAVAGVQPAAPPTGGLVAASDWTKGWDFEKERLNIKKLLQVPQITSFSGQVVSDKPSGYAKLTLSWNASHPMSVAEYSLDIPKYSIPVKFTPPTTTDPVEVTGIIALQPPAGTQQPPTGAAMIPGTWTPIGSLVQDVVGMQAGTSPTTMAPPTQAPVQPPLAEPGGPQPVPITGGQVTSGPSTTHAWRSMASRTSSTVPFLLGVHEPGTYEVWLRARGEGGLAVQRLATINIQYAFAGSPDGQDFGAQKKSDVLASADDTAPTTPLVDDGGAKTDSRTLLFVTWSSTDYESGIQEYQYRVVSKASGQTTPVTVWLSAGGQSEVNIRLDQPMQPALIYYVEVKARNGAGAWSATGSTDGIQLSDPTPPSTPGGIVPQVEKDTLRVAWKPARDPESKVMGYRYAIGSRPDNTNMLDWTYTQQPGFEVDLKTLSELPEKGKSATIYVSVCAVNGIGVDSPIATAQASVAVQTKL